jgi:hypothetical protein
VKRRSKTCWEATTPFNANVERRPSGNPSHAPPAQALLHQDKAKNRKDGSLKLTVYNRIV